MKKVQDQMSLQSPSFPATLQLSTANESSLNNSITIASTSTSSVAIRQHPKYGNLVVLFENDHFFITLGPDYICFLLAIICFSLLYFFTIKAIYSQPNRHIIGMVTIVGAVIQIFSYLIIAISNPGIITQDDFDTEQIQSKRIKRQCNICNLPMLPRSRHCSQCNVCIKGYDHHCPWTSKCIGQNNLYRFYFFACYTPLFLIYCVIVLSIV